MKKGPKTIQSGLHKDFSLTTAQRYIHRAMTKILIIYEIWQKWRKNIHGKG